MPRIKNAVARECRLPALRVHRELHAGDRRVGIADLRGHDEARAVTANGARLHHRRDVVDLETAAFQFAHQRRLGRIRARVRRRHLQHVAAVGHRGGVPHQQGLAQFALQQAPRGFTLAAIEHVVNQLVAVVVVGLPGEGLQTLLIDAPAERRSATTGTRRVAALRRIVVQPGNLGFTARERLLEHGARRMHGDRRHLRTDVAWQVGRGQRGQHRARRAPRQHGAPLEVARLRAGNRRAFGVRVWACPVAPRFVWRARVAGAREDFDLGARRRDRLPGHHAPARDHPRVFHIRFESATGGASRRNCHQPTWVRGRHEGAVGHAEDLRGLLRGHAGDQHGPNRIATEAIELALASGGHE